MKEKLSTKKAIYLYAIILGFVFVFYLAALHFGSSGDEEGIPEQQAADLTQDPIEEIQDKVEFYEDLAKPLDSDQKSESTDEKTSESDQARQKATQPKAIVKEEPKASTVQSSTSGRLTVQVGAFATQKEAGQMIIRLRTKNFRGRILQPFGGTDKFFRVWIGEFGSRNEAKGTETELKQAGFLTYLRKIP